MVKGAMKKTKTHAEIYEEIRIVSNRLHDLAIKLQRPEVTRDQNAVRSIARRIQQLTKTT